MPLTDDDLLNLLHSTEHTFVERKTAKYSAGEYVKAIVAFANSLEPSQEGVLFIGASDNGEVQPRDENFDKLQKTLSEKLEEVFPPVYRQTRTIKENGRECLVVTVPGSSNKPHFAGSPYLRDGSKTVKAQPSQYDSLIAWRLSKAREIQQWVNKKIQFTSVSRWGMAQQINRESRAATVLACNQFYVTLEFVTREIASYPLEPVLISFINISAQLEIIYVTPGL